MLTYSQSKYSSLPALQNTITYIDNTIQNDINNLEIHNQGNLNVNKELYYNTTFTDYTFQRNNTIHKYDNRGSFIIQQNCILHINEKVIESYKSNYRIL